MPGRSSAATRSNVLQIPQARSIEQRIPVLIGRGYCRPCARILATAATSCSIAPVVCPDCQELERHD